MGALAHSYGFSGQPRRALPLYERLNVLFRKAGDKLNLAIGIGSIEKLVYFPLGELKKAKENLEIQAELGSEIKDELREGSRLMELGQLEACEGAFHEAARQLDAAHALFERARATQATGLVWQYRGLLALLTSDSQEALVAGQQARTLADEVAVERDVIHADWVLGAALVSGGKDLNAAAEHLTEALTRCRRINLVESEPDILLGWAHWHRAKGNAQEALAHAEEALAIADRCEYRLAQADIHNFLALLALDEDDREKARKEADLAKERAWCDGPPHCYKPALDEAEKMLNELGAK